VVRFQAEQLNKLRQGEATITMQRGERVELRFHLPEGLTWPSNILPEAYFADYRERAGIMRQPANRQRGETSSFNLLNLRPIGSGCFELRLTADTPPFYVAIHAPGFLQHFECGPFRLADAKKG